MKRLVLPVPVHVLSGRLLGLSLLLLALNAFAASAPVLRIENGAHMAAIRAIAADADGRTLLTASDDKTARLWQAENGKLLQVLRPAINPGNDGKLFAAALSPDGTVAAVAGWSAANDIYLFSSKTGALISRISGLPNVINRLAFSPDGNLLAVALWGGHGVRLYRRSADWKRFSLIGEEADYGSDAYGLAFSRDGSLLASSAYDGQIRLYALRNNGLWRQAINRMSLGGKPHALDFSPDGKWLAVSYADVMKVSVLYADTLAPAFEPPHKSPTPASDGGFASIAWSRDSQTLFAAGRLRQSLSSYLVRRWRDAGRAAAADFPVAGDSVLGLLALPGDALAYAAADGSWGVLRAEGAIQPKIEPLRIDFRAGMLQLSADAATVRFAQAGATRPASFDLAQLAWRRGNDGLDPLNPLDPPVLKHAKLRVDDWLDGQNPTINRRAVKLEPGETVLSMAIAPDGGAVALGTGWYLRLWAPDGHELWRVEAPAACFAVNLSRDGRWLVAGFGDGTLRWYRRSDGIERLAFYPHANRNDWIAWTPDGRYAASTDGDALIGWHLDQGADLAADFLPLSRFAERYHDPAGVAGVLVPRPTESTRPAVDIRKGLSLPPLVRLDLATKAGKVVNELLEVDVVASDRGAGVDELRLRLNGKVVATRSLVQIVKAAKTARTLKPQKAVKRETRTRFSVRLEPGRNELEAIALGSNRVESEPVRLQVDAPKSPERPLLHVLAIGVNTYRNSALNLDYSVPDASGVAEFFKAVPRNLFRDVRVHEMFDHQATRANILEALRHLRESRPEDAVLVYLAGHGETLVDDWFFIPHDVIAPEQPEKLRQGGLSSQDLALELKAIPARKIVILIDACKSGAAASGFRGLQDRRALAQLSRATGTHLIAATTKEQLASELPTLGHGVFTYTLLQGLQGKATSGSKDVTARKLMVYVEQALPELTKRYRAEEQYPVVNSTGMDFPLVLY